MTVSEISNFKMYFLDHQIEKQRKISCMPYGRYWKEISVGYTKNFKYDLKLTFLK